MVRNHMEAPFHCLYLARHFAVIALILRNLLWCFRVRFSYVLLCLHFGKSGLKYSKCVGLNFSHLETERSLGAYGTFLQPWPLGVFLFCFRTSFVGPPFLLSAVFLLSVVYLPRGPLYCMALPCHKSAIAG